MVTKLGRGVYQRGDIFWLAFQRAGKRTFVSLETTDEVTALARAREIRSLPQFTPAAVAKAGLERQIEQFLAYKKDKNIYSRKTARVHGSHLREFARAVGGDLPVGQVTATQANRHYQRLRSPQRGIAETTAQIHIRALHAFFEFQKKDGHISENPFSGLELAKIDKPARTVWCNAAERDKFVGEAPTDDLRFILLAGFHSGLRKDEIIEARVNWFDVRAGGAIRVQKTSTFVPKDREARFIPMTREFRGFLLRYFAGRSDPNGFAVRPTVAHGRGEYRWDYHRPYNEYTSAQKMRWATSHVMRHTFASLLVQAGVSIWKVSQWLGDELETTEKHYAHLAPQDSDIERMFRSPASV